MSRLKTMARFNEEVPESKPVTQCTYCEKDLHIGDTIYNFDGDLYCKSECVADAYCFVETLERGV